MNCFLLDSPHDAVDHLHDDLIDDAEEVDDHGRLLTQGSQHRAEGQAEEDDSQGVRPGPINQNPRFFLSSAAAFDRVIRLSRLESGLEEIIREEIPAQVQEVVHDVHFAVFGVAVAQGGLRLHSARVDGQHQGQADEGADQGRGEEVDDGPQSDHAVHLGIQRGRAWLGS